MTWEGQFQVCSREADEACDRRGDDGMIRRTIKVKRIHSCVRTWDVYILEIGLTLIESTSFS